MKINLILANRVGAKLMAATLAGCMAWLAVGNAHAAVNTDDPATRITHAKVFRERLIWVGEGEPKTNESEELWNALEQVLSHASDGISRVEQFIAQNPESGWVPSLRANLAFSYRESGRYSPALEHWQKAWEATKSSAAGSGKRVADYTLVNWTSLLASLGRVELLQSIFQTVGHRTFDNMTWQQRYNETVEGLNIMINTPGVAYKCGTFALANVGQTTKEINDEDFKELIAIPSPATGFSMTVLAEYAEKYNLNLIPVLRPAGDQLPVPAVIHWKQNHYAAIVAEKNGLYHVVDSTFGTDKWLSAKAVNSEASGHFFVQKDKKPADWKLLAKNETDQIFGKGFPNWKPDGPPDCPNCTCPPGGPHGGPLGGPLGGPPLGCSTCKNNAPPVVVAPKALGSGMAYWEVREPYIELWVRDQPLSYHPSRGADITAKVNYHQRETRPIDNNIYNFGPSWNCNWLAYMEVTDAYNDAGFDNYTAKLYAGGGGASQFMFDYTEPDSRTHAKFNRIMSGPTAVGFTLTYPDARVETYGLLDGVSTTPLLTRAFLTQEVTPEGYTTAFQYSTSGGLVLLTNIVDVDNRNTTFAYDTTYPAQISSIISPNSWAAHFYYGTNGWLTNIVDAVGLSSQFQYTSSNSIPLMTKMSTPYGATTFAYQGESVATSDLGYNTNLNNINSALLVTEPTGGKHLYLYRDNSSDYLSGSPDSSVIVRRNPYRSTSPGAEYVWGYIDDSYSENRNSFYWGPRQYDNLSTTNLADLTNSDYYNARLRHWYHYSRDGIFISPQAVSHTLGYERQPSPDGLIEGSSIWYGYSGKPEVYIEGTNALPNVTFQAMPGWDSTPVVNLHYNEYNQYGNVTQTIDTYSANDNSVTIALRTNLYEYDASGFDMTRQTLLVGTGSIVIQSNAYNAFHQVVTNYDALNQMTVYTYNAKQQLTSIKTPAGLTTTNIYDGNDRLIKTVDVEIGRTNSYSYQDGEVYQHTNELGLVQTFTHDALRRVTGMVENNGNSISNIFYVQSALPGGTGTNILDVAGTKDRLGNWKYFGVNGIRQRTVVTNELENPTFFNYCSCGLLESTVDALGHTNSYFYDTAGRLTNTVYADGYSTTNFYNILNQVVQTEDSSGYSVYNYFNNQGLPTAATNAVGEIFERNYDIRDRVTNSVDANGVIITNTYDDLGRLLTRSYPYGGMEKFGYVSNSLVAYTNQLGYITHYSYDAAQRKTVEINANNETNLFAYDAAGDLITLTDAKSDATHWGYDFYGRVTNKVDATTTPILTYAYDADGRLTNRWSIGKTNTFYAYDLVGNLTNITYQASHSIAMAYDADNRLTNMVDGVGTTRYTYTETGALKSEDGPWANDTISYTYSNRKRATLNLQAINSSDWAQVYGYDSVNRLQAITSPAGAFTYAYNPGLGGTSSMSSMIDQITLPNGAYITNNFDDLARLTATTLENSTNAVLNYHGYGYNAANQRTNQVRAALGTNYVIYAYDRIGQLTNDLSYEYNDNTPRMNEQLSYVYDPAGNLYYRNNNTLVQNFEVNSLNELTTATNNGKLTVVGTTTSIATNVTVNGNAALRYNDAAFAATNQNFASSYTAIAQDSKGRRATNIVAVNISTNATFIYDGNGNLLSDGLRWFAYDDENQLIRVLVSNAWKAEFSYDGLMRRRVRTEYAAVSTNWVKTNETRYVYDGNLVIQERDANNLPRVSYTRGKDLSGGLRGAGGIGGLLARTINGVIENLGDGGTPAHAYYHADGNGNITMLVNSAQIPVAKYLYDAFGNTLSKSGPLADANLYRFSSKEWHQNSGLVYYLYRYYDSNLQRWVNSDPINDVSFRSYIFHGLAPSLPNSFYFVGNNPNLYVDPVGLTFAGAIPGLWPGAGTGAAGAGTGAAGAGTGAAGAGAAGGAILEGGAIGAAAVCGWAAGTWVCNNTAAGDLGNVIGDWICPRINNNCAKEWAEAYARCEIGLALPNPDPVYTSGGPSLHDCARGFVSEACGGNPFDKGKPPGRRRIWQF